MFEVYAQTRYQQIEPIGIGEGMNSIVFRAFDPYLQREIAVKEIDKSKFGNDFDAYCCEARTMAEVANANIVPIEYVCETADHVALALPYYPNGSLQRKIKQAPLALRELLKTAHGILAGLSCIHARRLLHLDLKPSNVLFDQADRPLVADFGQTRRLSADGTVKFPALYKWSMPPETWQAHTATFESDIYQLGVLLYRCANGDLVYNNQKSAITTNEDLQRLILRGRFPDVKFFLPHIPKRLRTIIRKALQTDPFKRFRSATDLSVTLGRLPIAVDWVVNPLTNGGYAWKASRPGRRDLAVELSQNGSSAWRVRVWTAQGGEKRAKGVAEYWADNLAYGVACDHLTEVFADLSR